jgi:predicted site-specific integrase-resolvase
MSSSSCEKLTFITSKKAIERLGISIVTLRKWEKLGIIEAIRTSGNHRLYNVNKYLKECEEKINAKRKILDKALNKSELKLETKLDSKLDSKTSSDSTSDYDSDSDSEPIKHNIKKIQDTNIIQSENNINKKNICYIRVTTINDSELLEKQRKYMNTNFSNYEVIQDIGSGIDFERDGFKKIINFALAGNLNDLVILDKNIFCRFGYELFENIIKRYSNINITVEPIKHKELIKYINLQNEMINDMSTLLTQGYTVKSY